MRGNEWSAHALTECLRQVATSGRGLAPSVAVLESWTDGPQAFCIVYTFERFPDTLGLRRTIHDIAAGYLADGHGAGRDGRDPLAFGRNVADFDLSEPLGGAAEALRVDSAGVHWWGTLREGLPSEAGQRAPAG